MQTLNNREIAIGCWLVLLVMFLLIKPSTRKIVGNLVRIIFRTGLFFTFLTATAYIAIVVYFLYKINVWETGQLKTTILWLVTAGYVSLFHVTDKKKSNYFKETVKEILKFTVLIEFIAGLYPFSLVVELLFVPVVVLFSGAIAVGARRKENAEAVKLLNVILTLLGIFMLVYAVYRITGDVNSFATKANLAEFLLPPVLSLLYLPFLYVLSLQVNLKEAFIAFKNKKILLYAKWKAIQHFAFSKTDLFRWKQILNLRNAETKNDIKASSHFFKQMKRTEKSPPAVPVDQGWSPYLAKEFLRSEGLVTGFYQLQYGNEWSACSPYFDLKDADLSSNVAYYVEGSGDGTIAKKLMLVLNVYAEKNGADAQLKFLSVVAALYKAALLKPIPSIIERAILSGKEIKITEGNRKITVSKGKWLNHKFNGYDLQCVIRLN